MCLLRFFFNSKKKKKIYPSVNKFQDELFYNVFVIDKYSIDIESPCKCSYIENTYHIFENYFFL